MKKRALVRPAALATALCMLALQTLPSAQADSGRAMPRNVPSAYTQECAACHTAYPPGLLPAASWNRVMTGLTKHYGTDASLDAATVRQLNQWLQAHAGTYKRVNEEPPEDRITRSAWFEHKHRKIEPAAWRLASVKSAANCAACHKGADQGQFDDHDLRMPAGLDARSRRAWND
ncbi:cytochrome C [Acidovorax sp. HMWF029]|uniref:diheme cytochrome c n=1 Tax=Acidovorax sp. HMWF029 TaxID=2056863 RepID=UPI000D386FDD|nr:diheme cytochrome c [Acidovorax sp. HMWF029]PTT20295.1 cytochrome C [Acidovorax sp. HMWF029]